MTQQLSYKTTQHLCKNIKNNPIKFPNKLFVHNFEKTLTEHYPQFWECSLLDGRRNVSYKIWVKQLGKINTENSRISIQYIGPYFYGLFLECIMWSFLYFCLSIASALTKKTVVFFCQTPVGNSSERSCKIATLISWYSDGESQLCIVILLCTTNLHV